MKKYLFAALLSWALSTQAQDLSITTSIGDNPTYVEGDPIQLLVTTPKSGYLYLYLIDPEGRASLIFPNALDDQNQLEAGFFLQVPSLDATYQFTATSPYGQERVVALLTEAANEALPEQYDQPLLPRLNRQEPNGLIAEVMFQVEAR